MEAWQQVRGQLLGVYPVFLATIGPDRYRYSHQDDSDDENEEDEETREKATNSLYGRVFRIGKMFLANQHEKFPACGFVRNEDGDIITKHDQGISGRKNCQRTMQARLGKRPNFCDFLAST